MKSNESKLINYGDAITVKTSNGVIHGVYMGNKEFKNGKGFSVFYISVDDDGIPRKHRAMFNCVDKGTHNALPILKKWANEPTAKITNKDYEILANKGIITQKTTEKQATEKTEVSTERAIVKEEPQTNPCPSLDLEALIAHKIEALIASKIEEVLTKMLG